MRMRWGFAPLTAVLIALLLVAAGFAQETTAGLQGTIKDPQGLVVPKATVEVSGPALIGTKKTETDAYGYYRFANLPPGEYTMTVTAANFSTLKQTGLRLDTGKLPTIDIKLTVGQVEQTVEVSSAAPIVDVTSSKVQTNVTSEVIDSVPKGRSFQSLITLAPGARYEPLQSTTMGGRMYNGYQIDGASNSENSYLIEGQETSDVRSGQTKTNAPFEFIQEVQIKSSGFEAEYGGALGGVVNVIQKRGSNTWHGSVFTHYQADMFDSNGSGAVVNSGRFSRRDPLASAPTTRFDVPSQLVQYKKDHYRIVEPGFEAGGYLVRDRLWAFASTVPRFENITRTANWNCTLNCLTPITGPIPFKQSFQTYYSMARLDARVSNKIRTFGSWQYGYQRANGASSIGSNLPNADDVFGQNNSSASTNPFNFRDQIGFVAPNYIYNFGGDVTITPNIVATTRAGFFHNDMQDRGLPIGINYRNLDSNYPYVNVPAPASATALNGTVINGNNVMNGNLQTLGNNSTQLFDKTDRKSFTQDIAWFKKGFGGTHNLKFGYAFNKLSNDVLSGYNTAQAYVAFGQSYFPLAANYSACQAITTQNIANGWNTTDALAGGDTGNTGSKCSGLWGTVNFRELGTVGKVSSNNHSLYVQDAWTMGKGITVNAGVRLDKESLPTYAAAGGFEGINFGFGDKVAPRIGASWDVMQNGKVKIYGSFGYFFDIMKYQLSRGSFGGDYWHDCVYALDTENWRTLIPTRGADGHFCPTTGGANGTLPGLRFIENQDFRQPSNDPSNYLVDRGLQPMKQHEWVIGSDWAIKSNLGFEARYSRKRLDRTIEDAGIITPNGEQFYIVNPGEGINTTVPGCTNCPTNIKPTRNYDAVELRLVQRPSSTPWFGQFSYTYSRLRGNYSGLTSTDLSDGGGGRSDPNVSRSFDEPFMQFDSHGKVIDGPLATDRPHTFKAYGGYRLKWLNQETLIGLGQQWYSGTPLSSYVSVNGAPVFAEGRGKWIDLGQDATGNWVVNGVRDRRTSMFSQTDLNLTHELKVSKTNEAMRLGFEANVTNLFNQHSVLTLNSNMLRTGRVSVVDGTGAVDYGTSMTGYNYLALANAGGLIKSGLYGTPALWQDARSMRFKVKFTF
jgi:hypothetical protein